MQRGKDGIYPVRRWSTGLGNLLSRESMQRGLGFIPRVPMLQKPQFYLMITRILICLLSTGQASTSTFLKTMTSLSNSPSPMSQAQLQTIVCTCTLMDGSLENMARFPINSP